MHLTIRNVSCLCSILILTLMPLIFDGIIFSVHGIRTRVAPPFNQPISQPCMDSKNDSNLNLALGLLQFSDCMMETCMLLTGARVHEHW